MDEKIQVSCEMEITLQVVGGKWKLLILHYLMENGPKRYHEIQKFLKNASKKTLTNQLRELERDGVIFREVYPTRPVQVVYSVTEHGRTLRPILEAMCDWGSHNADERYEITNRQCADEDT